MMTFGGIEEKTVTLDEARAEQEAELLQAEALNADGAATLGPQSNNGPSAAVPSAGALQPAADPVDAGKTASDSTAEKGAAAITGDVPAGSSAGSTATHEAAAGGISVKKNNNTSVYVTGIPDDATEDEIAEEFARCGIIKQDADGNPRIKLYKYALSRTLHEFLHSFMPSCVAFGGAGSLHCNVSLSRKCEYCTCI